MQANVLEFYQQQILDMAKDLSEEKLRRVLAFTRRLKDEPAEASPLSAKEILALAKGQSAELKRQPRPARESQYEALLQSIQADVEVKNIVVEDYPLDN